MKSTITLTFSKILALLTLIAAVVVSLLLNDVTPFAVAIPSLAAIIAAQDVSKNYRASKSYQYQTQTEFEQKTRSLTED